MFDAPPPPTLDHDTSANAWSGDKPVYTAVLAQMQIVKVDESTKRDSATGAFLAPVKTYEHIGPTYDELNEEEAAAADALGDPDVDVMEVEKKANAGLYKTYEDHHLAASLYEGLESGGPPPDIGPDTGVVHSVYENDTVWGGDQYADDSGEDDFEEASSPLVVAETSIDGANSPRPSTQWEDNESLPDAFEEPDSSFVSAPTDAEMSGDF